MTYARQADFGEPSPRRLLAQEQVPWSKFPEMNLQLLQVQWMRGFAQCELWSAPSAFEVDASQPRKPCHSPLGQD